MLPLVCTDVFMEGLVGKKKDRAFFNYRPAQEAHGKRQAERKWSDGTVWALRTHR